MSLPIALQLYTVRDETERDFLGTLEKVAKMGYKGVEFAGYGDITAKQMNSSLKELGLVATASHAGMKLLQEKLDEAIEYSLEIGSKYIVCSSNRCETMDDFLKSSEFFDQVGEKCRANGLSLGYHNHDFEFVKVNGEYALDLLFSKTKPENLFAEIDTCWVYFAGVDPSAYVRKYSGRCPLIHLKDLKVRGEKVFTEVGSGIIDVRSVIKASEEYGAEWMIVEQDSASIPTLDSARISLDNLKKMQPAG